MKARNTNPNKIVLIILAAALLISGAAALVVSRSAPKSATREVRIYQGGKLVQTGHLGQSEDITVTGENGETNVIAFTENGVYMKSASCHNQLCIEQGHLTTENYASRFYRNEIICLPNRVTVELVLTSEEAAEIPDV